MHASPSVAFSEPRDCSYFHYFLSQLVSVAIPGWKILTHMVENVLSSVTKFFNLNVVEFSLIFSTERDRFLRSVNLKVKV